MEQSKVRVWESDVEIPTYGIGKPDKNPMFLEKRVYQGSSGKVYPHPVIDKIEDEKKMQTFHMVIMENEYLHIEIMPELGGRIYRALDRTNKYDFVYYNRVIKPALVGLAGPWISGGIEFNWPQHHRPNTYGPVDYTIEKNSDGSQTVWVSELDRMYGTKGMAGFTLYPGKAYLEITGQLYNRTPHPQTFLWWANPAVAVNDHTQSVFPPDVHAVFDHGKRDVSRFPLATGTYYKMDYSAGVDISRYKNIPVPTSYMAYHSDYNFVGGYDHSVNAGILHVANHHISPGKKQWTWGNGEFGQAWDHNLTDEDGPYIELMTGVYTDNQPDFTWLQPYEEKTFKQYFMPYKQIGMIKNATIDAAVNLELKEHTALIQVYGTSVFEGATIELKSKQKVIFKEILAFSPTQIFTTNVIVDPNIQAHDLMVLVKSADGKVLVSYQPKAPKIEQVPEAAKPIDDPEQLNNTEALYLAAVHLEQYRHATYEPDPYYLEGLKRDAGDIRLNNAYGSLLLRRCLFAQSEPYFRKAITTLTRHNPNPYDSEPYYNLGLTLKLQGRLNEAYDAFYKATWSGAWQDKGFFALAQIACIKTDYHEALDLVEQSIMKSYRNYQARNLKTAVLRTIGLLNKAEQVALETIQFDIADFGAYNELYMIYKNQNESTKAKEALQKLTDLMRSDPHNYLILAQDYALSGFYVEAIDVLARSLVLESREIYPMIYYYLAYFEKALANEKKEQQYLQLGNEANPDYCFPNQIFDLIVLTSAINSKPNDAKAHYYLGNLLYDKKRRQDAIRHWEKSVAFDASYPTVHRNLALAYYNQNQDAVQARKSLEKAFALNPKDARVFYELDQLYKKIGFTAEERLLIFENHLDIVELRDDLFIEYVTLLNLLEKYSSAKDLIMHHKFHPWEGGEGKVTSQYVYCHVEIAKQLIIEGKYEQAITELELAKRYPENIGEGKLSGAQENNINYYIGLAYEGLQSWANAKASFDAGAQGLDEPTSAMFYNDQPPEMIYYQGASLLKLGQLELAKGRFNKLVDYGEKHIFKELRIDYFAVSLPDFLVFDEDLNRKNAIHCQYMMGLGYLGLKKVKLAIEQFQNVLQLEPSHQGAKVHIKLCG